MIHVVKSSSHWQGASHYPVAIAPNEDVAEHVANLLSTCSFCHPGRTSNYNTGECYSASTMRVQPDVPTLPDNANLWDETDARTWFNSEVEA